MTTAQEALLAAFNHHQHGRVTEAEELYRCIIDADPGHAEAWHLAGVLAAQTGRSGDAAQRLRRAVALFPDACSYYLNLAAAHRAAGREDVAEEPFRRALRLRTDMADVLFILTDRWCRQGRWAEAMPPARVLAALDPGGAAPHLRIGVAANGLGRMDESAVAHTRAARADPTSLAAFNLAWLDAMVAKRHDRALERLHVSLAALPGHTDALCNMAASLLILGLVPEARTWYARASALEPHRADAAWGAVVSGLYLPQPDAEARFAEYRRYEERFARPFYPAAPTHAAPTHAAPTHAAPTHANVPDPERRLRVGYLTTDLRARQPVTRNLQPIFEARDRERFELFLYSDIPFADPTTERFRDLSDGWRVVAGLDDRSVAETMRADGIDVLVILAGHFDRNRPTVCAHRPAPVQISHHDVATSAMPVMDALITDPVMAPHDTPERFTERLVRLPSYVMVAPPDDAPPPVPPPMLRNGFATFGCFNNPAKLSDDTVRLWARVLAATPGARLRLKYQNLYEFAACRDRILHRLAEGGVDPARVEMPDGGITGVREHLLSYEGIDVALDPFPFSGSTTTFEALFMGVPVVTLPPPRMVGRWSASMLTTLGLTRFIAHTPDDYVAIAARTAADANGLAALRAGLRERVLASSLCDGRRMARNLERVYRALWRRWCAQGTRASAIQ